MCVGGRHTWYSISVEVRGQRDPHVDSRTEHKSSGSAASAFTQ